MVFGNSSLSEQTDNAFRIMVVDDSAVMRNVISRVFSKNPTFQITATAENGEDAVHKLLDIAVDVIILDIDMPVMDGLKAIPLLKAIDPAVQIIMASALTHKNAEISLRALELGAIDYISKPSTGMTTTASLDFSLELIEKVKVFGALARQQGVRLSKGARRSNDNNMLRKMSTLQPGGDARQKIILRPEISVKPDIIAIGSSTGGPDALLRLIKRMGNNLSQPILITQHMPPTFTGILAERIAHQCDVVCKEAVEDEVLQPGSYYVAPGDYHMLIVKGPRGPQIKLVQDARENFCRPAVDAMLRSLPDIYGSRILVVMLTGMGVDGVKGSQQIVAAGGTVYAQNEATSVVWGMPGAVATAGLCSAVLPLDELALAVRKVAVMGHA